MSGKYRCSGCGHDVGMTRYPGETCENCGALLVPEDDDPNLVTDGGVDVGDSEPPTCRYVGNERAGFDTEREHDNGVVTCEADAQVIVRLKSPRTRSDGIMDARKTPVCQAHGGWLQESDEVEINWEICGSVEPYTTDSPREADR